MIIPNLTIFKKQNLNFFFLSRRRNQNLIRSKICDGKSKGKGSQSFSQFGASPKIAKNVFSELQFDRPGRPPARPPAGRQPGRPRPAGRNCWRLTTANLTSVFGSVAFNYERVVVGKVYTPPPPCPPPPTHSFKTQIF